MTSSRSVSRGRSRSQSRTPPPAARQGSSPAQEDLHTLDRARSRTRSRSRNGRGRSPTPSQSRSPEPRKQRNGYSDRDRARSRTRSRSPSRDGRRSYRERSYSHSRSRSRGRRPQSSKIVVEKLTKNVNEAHLQEIFSSYGRIESIDLPMNRQFMTNRGTAYIVYESAAGSESAIAHMHEAQLDGSTITVSIVLPRRAFSRSPPPVKSSRPLYSASRYGPPRGSPSARYRGSSPRRGGYNGRPRDWDEPTRNGRDYARSPSQPRRRERSHSYSRSPSRTPPPRRRGAPARSPPRRRKRSVSYSSYSSYSRSRSRTRTPSRTRYGNRK